ncbi:MAG: hypothetical protein WDW36_004831 [Sanguina aurantia]
MNTDDRRLIRQIIRQVHPDLFAANPYERQCNSDSLQMLNVYVDSLARRDTPSPARLEFYVREAGALLKRQAELPTSGSLAPLFYAFNLISVEELRTSDPSAAAADTNFLSWLHETVQEAVRTAGQHEELKAVIRKHRDTMHSKFHLTAVLVGAEYAVSLKEQERQVASLVILEQGLTALYAAGMSCHGLRIQLYHPDTCPVESHSFVDSAGHHQLRTTHMRSYVADDGCLHLVADISTLQSQVEQLDLERARMLAFVSDFWLGRVKELTPAVQALLGVKAVWCDTKTEQNSQKFVIWAGYLLERREELHALLQGRKFCFSLIVHSEGDGPLIHYHTSSPILNVRTDCPPSHLMEFLVSEMGTAASEAATAVQSVRELEEALLDRVRVVFGLKCIIKICMNDRVLEGARRLLDNADAIKAAVHLVGASIALDDCYEVWDSGFISIPYNFNIAELPGKLLMLQSGTKPTDSSSGSSSGSGSSGSSSSGADTRNAHSHRSDAQSSSSYPNAAIPVQWDGVGSAGTTSSSGGSSSSSSSSSEAHAGCVAVSA